MKKRPEKTQTLRAGCILRGSQKFSPRCRPLPGGAGRPKFNQLDMVVRRLRHDLILIYKIICGLTDMNPGDFFTFANSNKIQLRAMHTNSYLAIRAGNNLGYYKNCLVL